MVIPKDINELLTRLDKAGYDAVVVGGCVRDTLRGKPPQDWDVATSALPEQIKAVFADRRILDYGAAFGTVTVESGTRMTEITTYRADGDYADHRHPVSVTFTDRLTEDLRRRDFTVNAMAYHPEKGLFDPFDGQNDLANGIIRCVGDPDRRLDEDALRIMRAIRFASVLGFAIEPETAAAMRRKAPLLASVAAERIWKETEKWISGDPASTLAEFTDVLSCLPAFAGLSKAVPVDRTSDPVLRLAMVLDATTPRDASLLKVPKSWQMPVNAWLAHRDDPIPPDLPSVKRALRDALSPEWAMHLWEWQGIRTSALLQAAQNAVILAAEVIASGACYRTDMLAVSGSDLLSWGVRRGQVLGDTLRRLTDAVIDGACKNEKNALFAYWKNEG